MFREAPSAGRRLGSSQVARCPHGHHVPPRCPPPTLAAQVLPFSSQEPRHLPFTPHLLAPHPAALKTASKTGTRVTRHRRSCHRTEITHGPVTRLGRGSGAAGGACAVQHHRPRDGCALVAATECAAGSRSPAGGPKAAGVQDAAPSRPARGGGAGWEPPRCLGHQPPPPGPLSGPGPSPSAAHGWPPLASQFIRSSHLRRPVFSEQTIPGLCLSCV